MVNLSVRLKLKVLRLLKKIRCYTEEIDAIKKVIMMQMLNPN